MVFAELASGRRWFDVCDVDRDTPWLLQVNAVIADVHVAKPLKNHAVKPATRLENRSRRYKLNARTSRMVEFIDRISTDVVAVDERLGAPGLWDEKSKVLSHPTGGVAEPDPEEDKTIVATTILALLMRVDNLCWLLTFLGGDNKHIFAAFYVFGMCFIWALAWPLYFAAEYAEITHPDLPVEEITDVASTLFLIGLTAKFFSEWFYEEDEEDDVGCFTDSEEQIRANNIDLEHVAANKEVQLPKNTTQVQKTTCGASCFSALRRRTQVHNDMTEDEKKEARRKSRLTYSKLLIVSFGANFNNISVYIPIMLSGVFSPIELIIGDFIAAVVIALISLGLSAFKVLTDFFTQVPLWVILGIFTLFVAANCCVTLADAN